MKRNTVRRLTASLLAAAVVLIGSTLISKSAASADTPSGTSTLVNPTLAVTIQSISLQDCPIAGKKSIPGNVLPTRGKCDSAVEVTVTNKTPNESVEVLISTVFGSYRASQLAPGQPVVAVFDSSTNGMNGGFVSIDAYANADAYYQEHFYSLPYNSRPPTLAGLLG